MFHYARTLLGKAAGLAASVPAGTYMVETSGGDDAICTITFNSSGTWSAIDGSSGTWKTGSGAGTDYWIRWTNSSGTLSSGTAGTWQRLNANRSFTVTFTAFNGSKSCTGFVEIATDSGGANVIASGSISITAQVTP